MSRFVPGIRIREDGRLFLTRKRVKPAVFCPISLPVLFVLLAASPWNAVAQQPSLTHPPVLNDVEAAFSRIETRGAHVTACAGGLIPRPQYRTTLTNFPFGLRNHFQGIQRLPQPGYLVISGSSRNGSDLFIVRLGDESSGCDGRVVARAQLDDVLGHAGGLSTLGSILAVPLHGGAPRVAKVVFYDLAEPESPRRLPVEITRPGRKASATALTRLPNGHYLVAVLAAFDGLPLRLDFYLSRTTKLDDGFLPEPVTWPVSLVAARPGQDRTFNHFQTINFIRQADGRLYLIGFHNRVGPHTILPGRDYADLYEVRFPSADPILEVPTVAKVANRMLRCTDGFCSLDAASGLFVDPVTKAMSVYATPGWLDGDTVKVTVYQSGSGESVDAQ
jgi:hypothetical protein